MTDLDTAACRGVDPEIFYATKERDPADVATALEICRNCPVRQACLEQAMEWERGTSGRWGIFGGLTALQRSRLPFRAKLLAPCGTPSAGRRHRRRGEPVDDACADALSLYDRQRKGRAA